MARLERRFQESPLYVEDFKHHHPAFVDEEGMPLRRKTITERIESRFGKNKPPYLFEDRKERERLQILAEDQLENSAFPQLLENLRRLTPGSEVGQVDFVKSGGGYANSNYALGLFWYRRPDSSTSLEVLREGVVFVLEEPVRAVDLTAYKSTDYPRYQFSVIVESTPTGNIGIYGKDVIALSYFQWKNDRELQAKALRVAYDNPYSEFQIVEGINYNPQPPTTENERKRGIFTVIK